MTMSVRGFVEIPLKPSLSGHPKTGHTGSLQNRP
jgi:hypothetical protein